jgi:hypothetical protein
MTMSRYAFAFPRRNAPESCMNRSPNEGATRPSERARGMPGARCTRSPVCDGGGSTRVSSPQVHRNTRHSRAQWF